MSEKTIKLLVQILAIFSVSVNAQNTINGEILINPQEKDTIIFFNGTLNPTYYEVLSINAPIDNAHFKISEKFNYPHLYVQVLTSVRNSILFKSSFLFLDSTTKKITIDKNIIHTENDGIAQNEFKDVFIPFITNDNEELKKRFYRYTISETQEFDERLQEYVKKNPDSYVALWFVAQRSKNNGNNIIHRQILNSFSNALKTSKLWISLNQVINKIEIHIENPFPSLLLKNKELETTTLEIKKNEITLIDFWFSTCKPCIEAMPKIKSLYEKYSDKGFNVISISTDKEKHVDFWKTQIGKLGMNWENHLDLNGEVAKQNSITSFPTVFLIDKNGIVIAKDIEFSELEIFLEKELN